MTDSRISRRDFVKGAGTLAAASTLPVSMVELAFADPRQAFNFAYISDSHIKHIAGDKPRKEVTQAEEDAVMRYAIAAALEELGYLKAGRGRNYSTTSSQKSGKHI